MNKMSPISTRSPPRQNKKQESQIQIEQNDKQILWENQKLCSHKIEKFYCLLISLGTIVCHIKIMNFHAGGVWNFGLVYTKNVLVCQTVSMFLGIICAFCGQTHKISYQMAAILIEKHKFASG
jgi:hypothetical protein